MFVHKQTGSLLVDAPDPGVILAAMPSRKVDGQAGWNVQVKHTEEATKALRAMGHAAPSPIMTYYDWPLYKGQHQPFSHQKVMAEFMTLHRRCFNLSEMGTMKTDATCWAMDYLHKRGDVHKTVIFSPLSTLESVWLVSLFQTFMHLKAVIVHGSREKRMAALESNADVYIINHDGVKIAPLREAIRSRKDIDLIIVDEGSKLRNSKTDMYKAMEKIVGGRRLWWLTGTPTPKAPSDAWAQCRLVNPSLVPSYFGSFRDMVMQEVREHIFVPKANAKDIVFRAMQPAIRFEKKDCIDLPPVTMVDWKCDLSADQAKAYKQMVLTMKIEDQEARAAGRGISAVNAADKIQKLRQIMLGSVKAADGSYTTFDYGPRFAMLLEAIEMASGKVIIVAPFKGIVRDLAERIRVAGYSCGLLNGDVSATKRNRIISDFKTTPDPHTLLCHPTVMAHGLNLTEADVLIFFGPIYSNDEYQQVLERFNRAGQTRKMTVIRIGCSALEWGIYKRVDEQQDIQAAFLDMYREILDGEAKQARTLH